MYYITIPLERSVYYLKTANTFWKKKHNVMQINMRKKLNGAFKCDIASYQMYGNLAGRRIRRSGPLWDIWTFFAKLSLLFWWSSLPATIICKSRFICSDLISNLDRCCRCRFPLRTFVISTGPWCSFSIFSFSYFYFSYFTQWEPEY